MGKKKRAGEYEAIWDFAIGYDYLKNGTFRKQKDVLEIKDPGITNKTDDSPDDILQIAVRCHSCNAFMNFQKGSGWCDGKYVCPVCGVEVDESDPINEIQRETDRWNDEFNDIFGSEN